MAQLNHHRADLVFCTVAMCFVCCMWVMVTGGLHFYPRMRYETQTQDTAVTMVRHEKSGGKYKSFAEAVTNLVSSDGIIILSMVDKEAVAMAINFHLTSLKPHNIQNYLFLTLESGTCHKMERYAINCFQYQNSFKPDHNSSVFGSQGFISKMNIRTDIIIDALELGYSVLHSDVDMLYLKNPLRHISCEVSKCHLAALMEAKQSNATARKWQYNAGFIFLNPPALPLYRKLKEISIETPTLNDQLQLNKILKQSNTSGLKTLKLPIKKFACGRFYYEEGQRIYADTMPSCPDCVVVHNNWLVSLEAKIYRAKELHHWENDENQYYSSKSQKYFTYDNGPRPYDVDKQILALKTAIAVSHILNRTLILPKFYCESQSECGLNFFLKIREFDRGFHRMYREHSFLIHKMVPRQVKYYVYQHNLFPTHFTSEELWQSFHHVTHPILKFREINFNVTFHDSNKQYKFDLLIKNSFIPGTYMND